MSDLHAQRVQSMASDMRLYLDCARSRRSLALLSRSQDEASRHRKAARAYCDDIRNLIETAADGQKAYQLAMERA